MPSLSRESCSSGGMRKLPCLQGWPLSINALIGLWKDLRMNVGYTLLLTNTLNQDCVQNLFSINRAKMRKKTGTPDCHICHSVLFAKSGEANDETYMFIRKKSYNELGDTGLCIPSAAVGTL